MSPLVSVLIPCFNAAPYIKAAIESVCRQTYARLEIIVVDDGSKDNSVEVVRSIARSELKILSHPNAGAAAARNTAFAASRGELIVYFDADDLMGPDHIERLVAAQARHRGSISFGEWDRFTRAPEQARFPARPRQHDQRGVDWLVDEWNDSHFMTQPGMFMLPRDQVESGGGWNKALSLNDDFEFFARHLAGVEATYAKGARLYYRSGLSSNLAGRRDRKSVTSSFDALLLGTQHVLKFRDDALARRAAANAMISFVHEHYPRHPDLRARLMRRIAELGGASAEPVGPPRFHVLRKLVGWRAARLIQIGMGR